MTKPVSDEMMTFVDGNLRVRFKVKPTGLAFDLQNISPDGMRVLWDDASLVLDGEVRRVVHKGVILVDKDKGQVTTVIPPGAHLKDYLAPIDNVRFSHTRGWRFLDIWPTRALGWDNAIRKQALASKGKTFTMYLPLIIGSQRHEYRFDFAVEDVVEN